MVEAVQNVRRSLEAARRHVSGPLLLATIILAVEALRRTPLAVPNPSAILLLGVVYSAFVDPRGRAYFTTALAVVYTAIYFSPQSALFGYAPGDGYRVLLMLFVAPIMAAMVLTLRARTEALALEAAARRAAEAERDHVRALMEERARAEEELKRARADVARGERMAAMGAMVGGVAHEIRTPLAVIANQVELTQRRIDRAHATHDVQALADVPGMLAEVRSAVERANTLVVELRRFLKAEPGQAAPVDLAPVVHDAVRMFELTHGGRVSLQQTLLTTPEVLVDPVHVQQIVLNLLENAAAASAPGGPVRILVHPRDEGAEIVVEDRGEGMAAEVKARAFDPFFTTKSEGTGLGLAIVHRLVELHHGSITCDSSPGLGTTFRVRFPARPRHVPVRKAAQAPPVASPATAAAPTPTRAS